METHNALEMLVWPLVRATAMIFGSFALLKMISIAFGLLFRGTAAAEAPSRHAGPTQAARTRVDRANSRVAEMSR